jgi:transcriptional regulator of acetoin/glycerol metabolism
VEISDALRDAEGLIPRAEAARLIGVHRTTLYRVYLNGNG